MITHSGPLVSSGFANHIRQFSVHMTVEEDLAIIRLRDKLVAKASKPDAAPKLKFRLLMLQRAEALETKSRKEWESRRLERLGRIDKVGYRKPFQFWEEVHKVTEPNEGWLKQEETYNVTKDSRARPPPPQQATLNWG